VSKRSNLEKRARAQLARNAATRAALNETKDKRAARASVANGAAALAPAAVSVGLLCPKCRRCVMVAATVNGREVGAPFCPACGVG
jgi:hypothetical protein